MSESTPETSHYGLTRVSDGEALSKNGWAATDLDRLTLDDLLYALEFHNHSALPRLADPVGTPTLTLAGDGILPASATLYYVVSYLDGWGLESAGSAEAAITTPDQIEAPTAPAASIESGTGGTLGPGQYSYAVTAVTAVGGETTADDQADVSVTAGTDNTILLTMPDLPTDATAFRIYRSRPGQDQLYFWMETAAETVSDDGSLAEDPTIVTPGFNTTNQTNAVTVTVPGGAIPAGVSAWRIYRSIDPGNYDGNNLVHEVTEGETELSTVPRASWIDTGATLQSGAPRRISATISGGKVVRLDELAGTFPVSSMPRGARQWDAFVPDTVVVGKIYTRTRTASPISPNRVSAYFIDPPTTDPAGAQVGFEVSDEAGDSVTVRTDGSGPYAISTYPLTSAGTFQAEDTEQPDYSQLTILDDPYAGNGQVIELNAAGEYVEIVLGELDQGTYRAYVRLRSNGTAWPANDVRVQLIDQVTSGVLATQDYTVAVQPGDAFYELGPLTFTAPGGQSLKIVVTKMQADTAGSYLIDTMRYETTLAPLAAGTLTLRAVLLDSPTAPAAPAAPTGTVIEAPTRVYVREGMETSVGIDFATSDDASVSWTASDDQTWVTLDAASGTGATGTVTATVDFTGLAVGSRSVATVTIAATGYTSATVQLVTLRAPAVPGGNVNVSVQY